MSMSTPFMALADKLALETELKSHVATKLLEMMLNDDTQSEESKTGLRLIAATKNVCDTIHDKCDKYMHPDCTDTETQKHITEYLCSIQQNMTAFFDVIKKNGG